MVEIVEIADYSGHSVDQLKRAGNAEGVAEEWERRARLHCYVPGPWTAQEFFLKKIDDWTAALDNCPTALGDWVREHVDPSNPVAFLQSSQGKRYRIWVTTCRLKQGQDLPAFFLSTEEKGGSVTGHSWSKSAGLDSWRHTSGPAGYADKDKYEEDMLGKLLADSSQSSSFTPSRTSTFHSSWNEELQRYHRVGPHPLPYNVLPDIRPPSSGGIDVRGALMLGFLALVALYGVRQFWASK